MSPTLISKAGVGNAVLKSTCGVIFRAAADRL